MHRTLRRCASFAAAVALLAGCSSDGGDADDPSSAEEIFPSEDASAAGSDGDGESPSEDASSSEQPSEGASPSASPTPTESGTAAPSAQPSDEFAVPDEITEEYIERVLNELNRISGEISRDVLRREVDPDATELPAELDERLSGISRGQSLVLGRRSLTALLREPDQRAGVLPADEYDQIRYDVEEILTNEPCVGVRVVQDFSGTDPTPESSGKTALAVAFLTEVEGANTTGWKRTNLLLPDVARGSAEEAEVRSQTAEEIIASVGEVCQ